MLRQPSAWICLLALLPIGATAQIDCTGLDCIPVVGDPIDDLPFNPDVTPFLPCPPSRGSDSGAFYFLVYPGGLHQGYRDPSNQALFYHASWDWETTYAQAPNDGCIPVAHVCNLNVSNGTWATYVAINGGQTVSLLTGQYNGENLTSGHLTCEEGRAGLQAPLGPRQLYGISNS